MWQTPAPFRIHAVKQRLSISCDRLRNTHPVFFLLLFVFFSSFSMFSQFPGLFILYAVSYIYPTLLYSTPLVHTYILCTYVFYVPCKFVLCFTLQVTEHVDQVVDQREATIRRLVCSRPHTPHRSEPCTYTRLPPTCNSTTLLYSTLPLTFFVGFRGTNTS